MILRTYAGEQGNKRRRKERKKKHHPLNIDPSISLQYWPGPLVIIRTPI
jgi:hypothetical protein